MIGGIILIALLSFLNSSIIASFKRRFKFIEVKLLNNLFWYHMAFFVIYYLYSVVNRSDSRRYYMRADEYWTDWFSIYKTGTQFIDFVTYPFVNYFFFSYEMMMVLFAWAGYLGFVYFYIMFKENITFKHKFMNYDVLTLLMFLPNMHFWTASLGKGSLIFLGIGMAAYGMSNVAKRKLALVLGLLVVYHVRPHVFMFMCIGMVVGLFTGRQRVPMYQKIIVLVGGTAAIFLLYDKIVAFAGLDSENLVQSFDQFSRIRSRELAGSGSGIDTSQYPLILKLFTFWFRPLFVDAPGVLGLFVSVENLFYVLLSARMFRKEFLTFFTQSSSLVKGSIVIFILSSIALSNTMSNMGIIIRQKSMVMYFYFYMVLAFLDYLSQQQHQARLAAMKKKQAQQELFKKAS